MSLAAAPLARAADATPATPQERLATLEQAAGGRLGVFALDTATGLRVAHRADERFPVCSTFKVLLAAAILAQSADDAELLERRIRYTQADLVAYSPISEKRQDDGMTVGELCAAAIRYSDNTAANLLMGLLGGPSAVTAYARTIGNESFRLDRWETKLNSAIPGDPRDTATPASMALSLQSLALGDALPRDRRELLNDWLRGNTTGARRVRAAIPADWQVGDKTGSGAYGTTNDIAVLWPPSRKPLVLAIYYTQDRPDAKWRDEVVAAAARIVMEAFA